MGGTRTFPLGRLQERFWRFWRDNRDSPAYIMPEVYFYEGDFDVEAATSALDETARRHESLRTTFREGDSGVVQVVSDEPAHAPVEVLDLRELSGAAQTERLEAAIDAGANTAFDLTARPPVRLAAILLSDNRTALVMAAHQIICDGTSMAIVLEEFGEIYRAARSGTAPALPPVPPGYGAFVTEQDGVAAEDLAYWTERLAGATGAVLPGNGGPASLDTYALSTTFEAGPADAVSAYARRAGSTPFAILLGAMSVMIAAATATSDVCVGLATSSRTSRFARTVGMLANLVVHRSRIELSRSFAEALAEVSLDLLDAIDFQDAPYCQVIDELKTGVDLVRTTFSAGALGGLTLGEGSLSERVTRTSQGPFDLTAVCDITPSGIAIDWQYALRTYSPELARGYCAAYHEIVAVLLERPDAAMDSLGLTEILSRHAGVRI